MMKRMKGILSLALTVFAMSACQNGNAYKVDGMTEGLEDGDTILVISTETNMAMDTLIVRDGKFSFKGRADDVALNAFMNPRTLAHTMFFTEPGTIHVLLSATGLSKVSGTTANDALQEMNQLQYDIEQEGEALLAQLPQVMDEGQRSDMYKQFQNLQNKMSKELIELAKRHINNEFGYTLITKQLAYGETLSTEELYALIEQMPEKFRQRKAVIEILQANANLFSTNEGDVIANFTVQTPEGESVGILDEVSKNRITVLDFWASWCQPCRNEMPFMKGMLERWQDKGLGIVGISLDDEQENWKNALSELALPWPQFGDSQAWESLVARSFKIDAIPFTVVVDQKGTILAKRLRQEELEQFVSEQLNKPSN